jgi:co-chaperonin GroES (HSP10)
MSNQSGLFPVGRAVLVEAYQPERKKSIIELPDEVLGREQMIEQRAVVIAIGPSAWFDEPQPRAKIGDHVLISKFCGHIAKGTLDDKPYRFVNDRDIFAVITEG